MDKVNEFFPKAGLDNNDYLAIARVAGKISANQDSWEKYLKTALPKVGEKLKFLEECFESVICDDEFFLAGNLDYSKGISMQHYLTAAAVYLLSKR